MDLASEIERNARAALEEDLGSGDLTAPLIAAGKRVRAAVACRQKAVICGQPWFEACLRRLDPSVEIAWAVAEGASVEAGMRVCVVQGEARALLAAERVALNFLQTLSGSPPSPGVTWTQSPAHGRGSSTPARRCRDCASRRSTPCGSAEDRITAWGSTTPC